MVRMATVTFDHVWKRYGDVVAVNDFTLEIQDEEFLILVGPSGCGKTTALRMVAGLEEISEGTLKIGDRVVNDLAPKDRDVAMVFQSYALYPHMSVRDNLAFGLKLRKVPKDEIEKRVQEAARTIELGNLLDRKPKQLSGGQRQRVALGRAIVREPAVFLMDEPLSNLDAKLRVQTRAEIARLHQRLKTTIVYVTHDQVEAMTMGDRIAVMNNGILQQVGPPQQLYEHPVNKFVAGFIGSPSMNFINVTPHDDAGRVVLRTENVELQVPDRLRPAVKEAAGGELTVGFRPEHFEIVNGQAPGDGATLRAACDVVEFLGNEELLHVRVGEHDLVAIVGASHRVKSGDVLDLFVPLDKIHIFDPESSQALASAGVATAAATSGSSSATAVGDRGQGVTAVKP
jgi:multiple sugar transport system ATP-binding protein